MKPADPEAWENLKKRGSGHYKDIGEVEPIDLYLSGDMLRHFALANIIKYAFRNRFSGQSTPAGTVVIVRDMEKIKHYADMIIAAYGSKV